MKKIFVSQPMNGKSEEDILAARADIIKATKTLDDEVEVIEIGRAHV